MSRHHLQRLGVVATSLALVVSATVWAQKPAAKPGAKRAAPPKFTPEETKTVFFENLFDGRVLNGDRPASFAANSKPSGGGAASPAPGGTPAAAAGGAAGGGTWSKIVSAGSIEDEVKTIKLSLD